MSLNNARKLFKSKDIVIILVLLVLSFVIFLFVKHNDNKGVVAQISYDGQVVKEIDLSKAKDEVFTLEQNSHVHFEIKDGKIRFTDVDCPDKICENVGFIYTNNSLAVCMPNRVVLTISSPDKQIDTIVN